MSKNIDIPFDLNPKINKKLKQISCKINKSKIDKKSKIIKQ